MFRSHGSALHFLTCTMWRLCFISLRFTKCLLKISSKSTVARTDWEVLVLEGKDADKEGNEVVWLDTYSFWRIITYIEIIQVCLQIIRIILQNKEISRILLADLNLVWKEHWEFLTGYAANATRISGLLKLSVTSWTGLIRTEVISDKKKKKNSRGLTASFHWTTRLTGL